MSVQVVEQDAWTVGDQPTLKVTLYDLDGTPKDLTDTTTELVFWYNKGPGSKVSATVSSPTTGVATYQITITTQGTLFWKWRTTVTAGTKPFHTKQTWSQKIVKSMVA